MDWKENGKSKIKFSAISLSIHSKCKPQDTVQPSLFFVKTIPSLCLIKKWTKTYTAGHPLLRMYFWKSYVPCIYSHASKSYQRQCRCLLLCPLLFVSCLLTTLCLSIFDISNSCIILPTHILPACKKNVKIILFHNWLLLVFCCTSAYLNRNFCLS